MLLWLTVLSVVAACSDSDSALSTNGTAVSASTTAEVDGSGGDGQELVTGSAVRREGAGTTSVDEQDDDGLDRSSTAGVGNDKPSAPEASVTEGSGPDLGRPEEIVADVRRRLDAAPQSGAETLMAIEPMDDGPESGESVGLRDGLRVNEAGEPSSLDQPAALACADVERALTALDEGATEEAAANVASAAQRAGESALDDVVAWSDAVQRAWSDDGADLAVLLGFLSACTHGGYEL